MNIFTTNQVNQVYPLGTSGVVVELDGAVAFTKSRPVGSVGMGITADGKNIYFKHRGVNSVTRSDIINIDSIMSITATPAGKMSRKLAAVKVTLNEAALSDNKPIVAEDYILRLKFQNPVGMSPDNQYWKYGAVHASNMTASQFYLKMASSLAKNMSRDATPLVSIYVNYSGGSTQIKADSDVDNSAIFNEEYTSISIREVEPEWILGVKQQKPLIFSVEPDVIDNGTDEVIWGDAVYSDGRQFTGGVEPKYSHTTVGLPGNATITNSKLMADYEYFYMGERADQYRMVGFPDYIPTSYIVKPDYTYGYDVVGIHYAYTGSNHAVQKSEKDITFIIPHGGTAGVNQLGDKAQSLLTLINTAVYGEESGSASSTSAPSNP